MARPDINRSGELEVFVRVIETGGFSAAARSLDMTPSAVSKLVARLEQRLGTRLLQRSTRQLQLTPEGCAFYERGLRVLADLEEAERCASAHAEPRGRLRVNSNVPFGQHFLLPLLPAFLQQNPQVGVDLTLNDEVIDLLEQRTDVAVRAGPLKSSSLVARRLGSTRMMIVAAPAYAQRHGLPHTAEALQAHNRLDIGHARAMQGWPVLQDGRERMVLPSGNARASNGDALRQLVLGGLGMARLAAFQVQADIAAGHLLPVLEEANPGDLEEVHAVFLGQGDTCRCGCARSSTSWWSTWIWRGRWGDAVVVESSHARLLLAERQKQSSMARLYMSVSFEPMLGSAGVIPAAACGPRRVLPCSLPRHPACVPVLPRAPWCPASPPRSGSCLPPGPC